ncbi:MAG: nucleoside monophosphate kinase [Cyanobacteria bacterium P01_A01_bin.45]
MKLAILGGSGSGKSTQAQILCNDFNIPVISTGDILREAINQTGLSELNTHGNTSKLVNQENNSQGDRNLGDRNLLELGHHAQSYVENGELVPDEIMIGFIRRRLKQSDVNRGWILEGYPRTAFQAEELNFLLEDLQQQLDWAIYLQVSEAVMFKRCNGRSLPDDRPEIVQRRIELFYDRTVPILEYYDRRRRLLTIDGDQAPELVRQNIIKLLGYSL